MHWHLLILELKVESMNLTTYSQSLIKKEKINLYFLIKFLWVCPIHEMLCWCLVFLTHLRHCLVLQFWKRNEFCNILTHSFPMHPFSTPWKHQKTIRFSDVFWGLRKGTLGTNRLKLVPAIFNYFFFLTKR